MLQFIFQGAGQWIAALPKAQQKLVLADDPELLERWDEVHGDRQTELVFIGLDMDREEIEEVFDDCLLTDEEMTGDWSEFADPLPPFVAAE